MLSKAKTRISENANIPTDLKSQVTFFRQDLTQPWPLENDSVDLMYGDLVLEHLKDLDHFFQESHRVLRSGGSLFICEFHPYKQYQGRLTRFPNPANPEEELNPPCFVHSIADYVNGGIDNGFKVTHVEEWHDGVKETPRLFSVNFVNS